MVSLHYFNPEEDLSLASVHERGLNDYINVIYI